MVHYTREWNVFQTTTEKVPGEDVSTWYVFQSIKEYIAPMLYKVMQGQKYEYFTKLV